MYLRYQLAKAVQDERLRTAAREQRAAEARRARTACPDHAAATKSGATARGAAKTPGKQEAIAGPGIPLDAISGSAALRSTLAAQNGGYVHGWRR